MQIRYPLPLRNAKTISKTFDMNNKLKVLGQLYKQPRSLTFDFDGILVTVLSLNSAQGLEISGTMKASLTFRQLHLSIYNYHQFYVEVSIAILCVLFSSIVLLRCGPGLRKAFSHL